MGSKTSTMGMRKRLLTFVAALIASAAIPMAAEGSVVYVSNVEELYTAVNNAANAGATVVLLPGVYALSTTDANGLARPNRGRLDLQVDMSLVGVEGDRGAVVIDPAALPTTSFAFAPGLRTGIIRIGRGTNAIESLTITGNVYAAAAISTDVFQRDASGNITPTSVRVAHVSASGSTRGVDVRNATVDMRGRRLVAELIDNDLYWTHEGWRVANFSGADYAEVVVQMSSNHSHQNRVGCVIENNRASYATISIQSQGDVVDDNGLGCLIGGALVSSGTANYSTTRIDAYGSSFANNTRTATNPNVTGPEFPSGGLLVIGAEVLAGVAPYTTIGNAVNLRLWDCQVAGNHLEGRVDSNFAVFGAQSAVSVSDLLIMLDNHALVQLRGSTATVDVLHDRDPLDLDASNTATVVQIR